MKLRKIRKVYSQYGGYDAGAPLKSAVRAQEVFARWHKGADLKLPPPGLERGLVTDAVSDMADMLADFLHLAEYLGMDIRVVAEMALAYVEADDEAFEAWLDANAQEADDGEANG